MILYIIELSQSFCLEIRFDVLTEIFFKIFFNSCEAIAGAIIGLILVFLKVKAFKLYWGAVF